MAKTKTLRLVITYQENTVVDGLTGPVTVWASLHGLTAGDPFADLGEDRRSLISKAEFRELAMFAPDAPIGSGRLVWDLKRRPIVIAARKEKGN